MIPNLAITFLHSINRLPWGESIAVRLELIVALEKKISLAIFDKHTNQQVLRSHDIEGKLSSLDWFDRVFWQVTLDGAPATEKKFARLEQEKCGLAIDAKNCTLVLERH
ncbi:MULTISPECIES: hypothetical protein [Pseudomonas]|uniref:Uncharacterized protein n=1 Tax=Pseudomonas quercus TaxID=2722792 RepID=A0ABX0YGC2_9PSED|nr:MULTISPECIES: hypothetical protein [Pseudomonas]MBF7144983.1 hypothetical protein [Pseudomonas sp. LY10J]NJP01282.1 hypothetical protein [Pseudomonas quercus]